MSDDKKYHSIVSLAHMWNCREHDVRNEVIAGKLRTEKTTRGHRIYEDDIFAYVEKYGRISPRTEKRARQRKYES